MEVCSTATGKGPVSAKQHKDAASRTGMRVGELVCRGLGTAKNVIPGFRWVITIATNLSFQAVCLGSIHPLVLEIVERWILATRALLSGLVFMDKAHGVDSSVIRELGGFIEHGKDRTPCGTTIA